MLKLKIIIGSTRPGRVGLPVGEWFEKVAQNSGKFDVEVLDLAKINLPFLDEPEHPRFKKYTQDHTKAWSAKIEDGDAYVFIIPEYNFGFTAPVKNALDFVSQEWAYKPMAFVSYGGMAGGTRAVQLLKPVITTLKMMPMYESVNIASINQYVKEGKMNATPEQEKAAVGMLTELLKWAEAMKPMRNQ